jgi:hypothetical protein
MNTSLRAGLSAAVLAASLVACGATAPPHPPTTAPTTLPTSISLSEATPLADLVPGNLQANMTDKLSPPQTADRTVYFGEVDQYDGDDEDAKVISSLPILAVKDGDDWRAVPMVGRGLADTGWKYVGAGPRPREVWGVLDTTAGDGDTEFVVAHATDGGNTFALSSFHKPCRQASVYDFAMDRAGNGRITLSLDEAVGRHKPGLYHYETTDGGATWTPKPRFEPDAMVRAESVPDEEQPDTSATTGKPSHTGWAGRRRPVVTLRAADVGRR